jgi:hypothetical protein
VQGQCPYIVLIYGYIPMEGKFSLVMEYADQGSLYNVSSSVENTVKKFRSSGLTLCFPSQGTRVQNPWGDLSEIGILLLALSATLVTLM